LRVNLGAVFRELFKGEEGGITITIKASKDGLLELFYKDDEQSQVGKVCGWMALLLLLSMFLSK
jgi:hypothetical protein